MSSLTYVKVLFFLYRNCVFTSKSQLFEIIEKKMKEKVKRKFNNLCMISFNLRFDIEDLFKESEKIFKTIFIKQLSKFKICIIFKEFLNFSHFIYLF